MWTEVWQAVFERLKKLLTSSTLLAYPNFKKAFILETDASGCLGADLAQEQEDGSIQPIGYASRTLQPHERNYGITELEGLGVVWATKHFRPYLYGHHCEVYTDHEALKSLLNTPQPSGKLARWGMALQELDLTILHRARKHNTNADALSWHPLTHDTEGDTGTPSESVIAFEAEEDLADLQRRDSKLIPIIDYLEKGILPSSEQAAKRLALTESQYMIHDHVLFRVEPDSTLRVFPPVSSREKPFKEAHGGRFGAHLGETKVYR